MEVIFIKNLLKFSDDDFEVWESENYGVKYFNISIEGYIGFKQLNSSVSLYQQFLKYLHTYLIDNKYEKTEKHNWKCVYQTRAIDICHDHDCYWVFLDSYNSTDIWDIYYYMEDVITQLEEVIEKTQ